MGFEAVTHGVVTASCNEELQIPQNAPTLFAKQLRLSALATCLQSSVDWRNVIPFKVAAISASMPWSRVGSGARPQWACPIVNRELPLKRDCSSDLESALQHRASRYDLHELSTPFSLSSIPRSPRLAGCDFAESGQRERDVDSLDRATWYLPCPLSQRRTIFGRPYTSLGLHVRHTEAGLPTTVFRSGCRRRETCCRRA